MPLFCYLCLWPDLGQSILPSLIMPKALAKSKHGRKARANEQFLPNPGDTGSKTIQTTGPSDTSSGNKDSLPHHKHNKSSSAAIRAEKRRDKVLKKLCDKASTQLPLSTTLRGDDLLAREVTEARAVLLTPDQMSLQDCPVSIQPASLWRSTTTPAPLPVPDSIPTSNWGPMPSSSMAVQASMEVGPAQGQGHSFFVAREYPTHHHCHCSAIPIG